MLLVHEDFVRILSGLRHVYRYANTCAQEIEGSRIANSRATISKISDGESMAEACKRAAEAPRFDDDRNVGGSRSRLVGSYSCLGSSLSIHFVRQQNLGPDCSFPARIRSDPKPTSSAESLSTPQPSSRKRPDPGPALTPKRDRAHTRQPYHLSSSHSLSRSCSVAVMTPTPPTTNSSTGASPDNGQFRVVRKRNRIPLSCGPCRHRK